MILVYVLILLGCFRASLDLPKLEKGKNVTFEKDAGSFVIMSLINAIHELNYLLISYFFLPSFIHSIVVIIGCANLGYSIYLSWLSPKKLSFWYSKV